ncbi:MAG: co-chaperone DjlA [Gammaproteobacteria bacterium]|nr:co-chaperone DjlA [Gammaproteobacteria bacterium]
MSWWGKVVGGALGFMVGGPLGAMLGAALGHNFDKGLAGLDRLEGGVGENERVQTAFFTATFSVMGHLAKADGQVTQDEIAVARHVMEQMQLDETQKKAAINLFNQGKQADFPLDDVLKQFRQECSRRSTLIQLFIEFQIATIVADGVLQPQETDKLVYIGERLGLARRNIEHLINMVRAQQHYAGGEYYQANQSPQARLQDAYAVLDVPQSVSDANLKTQYRKLMSQNHPDKLVAKGLPEEMIKIATEKTQEIKAAYEEIKRARGLN